MTTGNARFVELYEDHYQYVYAYCRRRTSGGGADDAVAETFLTAWRRIDDVPVGDAGLAWLYGVAYRVVGRQWRTLSRQRNLKDKLLSIGVEPVSPVDDHVLVALESSGIVNALSKLKPNEREVLRLHVWEELQHKEVAVVLGLSLDAAKKRFGRARDNLTREYNRLEKKSGMSPAAQKGGAL